MKTSHIPYTFLALIGLVGCNAPTEMVVTDASHPESETNITGDTERTGDTTQTQIVKEVLDFGDADWKPAPIEPPGFGDPKDPDDPDADASEDASDEDEYAPNETANEPQVVEPTYDNTSAAPVSVPSESSTFVETSPLYACQEETDSVTCDQNDGICETIGQIDGEDPLDQVPCCQDADCGCEGASCDYLPCQADSLCDCGCPEGLDPDCGDNTCANGENDEIPEEVADACPESRDPFTMFMSNDDSNSQASPILVRSYINNGAIVPASIIRIHEFLNYYTMSRPHEGKEDRLLEVGLEMRRVAGSESEFNMLAAAQAPMIGHDERPPYNLVFSLDTSGSMAGQAMDMLVASVRAMAGNLRSGDVISLVEWANTSEVLLENLEVTGPNDETLMKVIDSLTASGGTDLDGGLQRAYELAESQYRPDRINRVVLVSDGGANVGVTSEKLIGDKAASHDGNGIYLVGVGVGEAGDSWGYNDLLMDQVTDAGKGAYIFIDTAAEAQRMFGDHFLSNTAVAARNVQLSVTLPWYFGVKKFYGEQISTTAAKVDPQHIAPNDATSVLSVLEACDPGQMYTTDAISAKVTYEHPLSGEAMEDEFVTTMAQLVSGDLVRLRKSDVVVSYAKAFANISEQMLPNGSPETAKTIADDMAAWLDTAADALDDSEIREMAETMRTYSAVLDTQTN